VQQAGRFFNQADFDQQYKKRTEQCNEKKNEEEEAEMLRTDTMDTAREEFLLGTHKKYKRARLRDKVNAQLKLHEFSLEDRREKSVKMQNRISHLYMVIIIKIIIRRIANHTGSPRERLPLNSNTTPRHLNSMLQRGIFHGHLSPYNPEDRID